MNKELRKTVKAVGIVLQSKDGKFILQERDDKPEIAFPGMIAAWGGDLEAGETPIQAALRELNEELVLTLEPSELKFICEVKREPAITENEVSYFYFADNIDVLSLELKEGKAICIASKAEMYQLNLTPNTKRVLNCLIEKNANSN